MCEERIIPFGATQFTENIWIRERRTTIAAGMIALEIANGNAAPTGADQRQDFADSEVNRQPAL